MSSRTDSSLDPTAGLAGPHLPSHVYVHIPFCRMKCSYCDFYSVSDLGDARISAVITGIEAELTQWSRSSLDGVVETVYFGGGTPTVITGGLIRLVRSALEHFPVRAAAEVTVEANPDSLTPQLADALAAAGVTRVSVGIQSFAATELTLLGRVHTVDEARAACAAVTGAGLDLSVDLMCGIPGQSAASWVASLEQALETGAQHVSVYPLTLEPGTALDVAVGTGLAQAPDPDIAAEQMAIAEEVLAAAGIPRYEVANYATPGHESRHNLAYWTGRSYLGIGPAAHGMLDAETARHVGLLHGPGPDVARVRYGNPADIERWLTGRERGEFELLTNAEARREDVMLGLRLVRGVSHGAVLEADLIAVLDSLERDGLVERVTGSGLPVIEDGVVPSMRWKTTRRGWLLGNEVFERVWSGE